MHPSTQHKWDTFHRYENLHTPMKLSEHVEQEAILSLNSIEYLCQFSMEVSWYRNNDGGWPKLERIWPCTAFDQASHEIMDKPLLLLLNSLVRAWANEHLEEIEDGKEKE